MIEAAISPAKMEEIMSSIGAQRIAVLAPWGLCATLAKDVYQATANVSRQRGVIPVTLGLDGTHSPDLEAAIIRQACDQLAKREWRDLVTSVPDPTSSLGQLQKAVFKESNGWLRLSGQANLAQGNASRDDYIERVVDLVKALETHQQPPAERMYPIFNVLLYLTPQTYEGLADKLRGYRVIEILTEAPIKRRSSR